MLEAPAAPTLTICIGNITPVSPTGVVTASLAALAPEVPVALVAVTVKVYSVNSESPSTRIGLDAEVPVNPPGLDVAV
jgi:hypothetical protein